MTGKKSFVWLAALLLCLALVGCGRPAESAPGTEVVGPTPTPAVLWTHVQDRTFYIGDRSITLEAPGDVDAMLAELSALPALETVTLQSFFTWMLLP